ncbi:hypothetical protein EYF80_037250 [Liparis tanakae]|uniref:Uncharacterized protein n=1 Tax=Liparis tanakae TaxID=230148 RepID=A0A4Z2GI07_9TELE|nr:hypothetical protein EYF80_037250 [Liparis tanakae]
MRGETPPRFCSYEFDLPRRTSEGTVTTASERREQREQRLAATACLLQSAEGSSMPEHGSPEPTLRQEEEIVKANRGNDRWIGLLGGKIVLTVHVPE